VSAPRTPPGIAFAWWAVLLALVTAYGAIAAEVTRGLVGGFGLRAVDLVVVGASTAIAMLAILPMGASLDLPQALAEHWVPQRRWAKGRCPACGHDCRRAACTECGAPFVRPESYAMDLATLRRAVRVLVPAWAIGLAIGLWAVAADEAAFRREVDARRAADPELIDHARQRAWPASFSELRWNAGRGFRGPPPFESPKVAG
jgi:hypothetical protein